MTTDAHRKKARTLFSECRGDAETVISRLLSTKEALEQQVKELKTKLKAAEQNKRSFPRPVHLARLSEFTIKQANGDRRCAIRIVLKHIDPRLSDPLPDELEALVCEAAKSHSDLKSRVRPRDAGFDAMDWDEQPDFSSLN
jgi:cell division septum initiation protein DivIVA